MPSCKPTLVLNLLLTCEQVDVHAPSIRYTGTESVVQSVVTLKHFLAYSIENYHGVQRTGVDVAVSAYVIAVILTLISIFCETLPLEALDEVNAAGLKVSLSTTAAFAILT
jgi:hypothetical protein